MLSKMLKNKRTDANILFFFDINKKLMEVKNKMENAEGKTGFKSSVRYYIAGVLSGIGFTLLIVTLAILRT